MNELLDSYNTSRMPLLDSLRSMQFMTNDIQEKQTRSSTIHVGISKKKFNSRGLLDEWSFNHLTLKNYKKCIIKIQNII
jgi:hypothetical protein